MTLQDIQKFPSRNDAAGMIIATWDKVKGETLPPDWARWRVPVVGNVAARPSPRPPSPERVELVEFNRVTCRPFEHGRMWQVVFGRFQGTEILVESGVL